MADDLTNKSNMDAKLISLSEDWEVKYWTETLGCSVIHLKDAVKAVGHSAEKVRAYLKNVPRDNHL